MQSKFNFCRAPIAWILVLLLSGIPFPFIDSHPTDLAGLSDEVPLREHDALLREHLVQTPTSEHEDVGDLELHVHWICPVVANRCDCESICPDSFQDHSRLKSVIREKLQAPAFPDFRSLQLAPQALLCRLASVQAPDSSVVFLLGTQRLLI